MYKATKMKRRFYLLSLSTISILALVLGTIRIFFVVLHTPLLGYANNFDMIRTQACLNIWPNDPNIEAGKGSLYPIEYYTLRELKGKSFACVPSSELLFGYIGKFVVKSLNLSVFSIKIFGVVRALTLAALAIISLFLFLRKKQALAGFAFSLIYLIVLADPANTLYLNTFYSEYSALLFTSASIIMLWIISTQGDNLPAGLCLGIFLLLLGISKPQHILMPFAIMLGQYIVHWKEAHALKRAFYSSLVSILIVFCYYITYSHYFAQPGTFIYNINYANATDTFLGAILPSTDDPYKAGEILGLPVHCIKYSGLTWYTGIQDNYPCPEVLDIPRYRIITLLLRQPNTAIKLTQNGILLLRPWTLEYLRSVADNKVALASDLVFSISKFLDIAPIGIIKTLFLLPGIICILGIISTSNQTITGDIRSVLATLCSITFSLYTVFYSSLFGDGYFEFSKHAHLFFSLAISLLVILIVILLKNIYQKIEHFLHISKKESDDGK